MLRLADKPFIVVREEALCLVCEEEASIVAMRPVEKAASGLSGPVGGSVSYVSVGDMEFSSIDTVVSDAVLSDACDVDSMSIVPAIDESVCGVNPVLADGILNLCGIDTVVSGNISGGLCDLDRVSVEVVTRM